MKKRRLSVAALVVAVLVGVVVGVVRVGPASAATATGWLWTETNYNASSGATTFGWGASSPCRPISGDLTNTGNSHVGLACYNPSSGWTWHEDTGSTGGGEVKFGWGGPSGSPPSCQPITGDWAGYGIDHVGLACYNPSSGWTWREDTGSTGGGEIEFGWGGSDGDPSHCHPITGDWNNYGLDHVGLACWTSGGWIWHEDTGSTGGGEIKFGWGAASNTEANCTAISGNWTGGTQTRVGLACWTSGGWQWREATGGQGGGQVLFGWGGAAATPPTTIPLAGDWDGDGDTTVATVNSNGLQLNYGTTAGTGRSTNYDWASLVLTEGGWPTSTNNITVITQWMASEEPPSNWWDRNNPLNSSDGTDSTSGLGTYPDLPTAASWVLETLHIQNYGYPTIVADLAASAAPATTAQAIWNSSWASSHYGYGANWYSGTVPVIAAPAAAWG